MTNFNDFDDDFDIDFDDADKLEDVLYDDIEDLEDLEADDYEDEDAEPIVPPDLETTLAALRSRERARTSNTLLYGLSGLGEDDLTALSQVWATLDTRYRLSVVRDLVVFAEANIEMDYRAIGISNLHDADPSIRETAIELLWEDQSLEVMNHLIALVTYDPVSDVRAAAASALGRYILMGEVGELPAYETAAAQQAVMRVLQDPKEVVAVQRRALEAISNCSHPIVERAIDEAYNGTNHEMRVSAVYAMGRSYDDRWHETVLSEIDNPDPEMRYEAARAAGELEIELAVPKLSRLIIDNDREILQVAVWSLGEIGGKEALRVLEALADKAEEEEDDDLLLAVEDAIGSAAMGDGIFGDFDMDSLN